MKKLFFLLGFWSFLTLLAEEKNSDAQIRIVDDEQVLSFANGQFSLTDGSKKWMAVSNASGWLPVPEYLLQNPEEAFILSLSYIGYQGYNDTFPNLKALPKQIKIVGLDNHLSEVVVSAQYMPTSTADAVHKVDVIDQKKIKDMAAVNLRDLLTNSLNIRLNQDNVLGSSMSLQGLSGENVKIMIDGVPVIGRQNGNIDLSQINLNAIERVELIEGPLSVNYGSNALAGTLNIITKKASQETYAAYVNSYAENIGTYNIDAGLTFSQSNHFISISGGRNFFDGWRTDDQFFDDFGRTIADSSRSKTWNPRTQYFGRFQYNYQFDKIRIGYRGEYFNEKITNKGLPRAPYYETAFDDYYYTTRIDQSMYVDGQVSENKFINITAAYNYFKRRKNTFVKDLTTLEESLTENPSDQDTSVFQQWMSRGNFSQSKEGAVFNYELGYDINIETARGRRIEDQQQMIGDYALFASAEITPFDRFTIRPGLRYSYNTGYRAPVTPSLNLRYRFKDFTLRTSYARGFRAPGIKELYFYFVDINHNIVGNPNLKAEYGHNVSFDLQHQKSLSSKWVSKSSVSSFYNNIQNLITLAQLNGQEFTYTNIGRFQTTGVNLEYQLKHPVFEMNLNGAYIGRSNEIVGGEAPEQFSFFPQASANLVYKWKKTGLQTAVFYMYQGRMPGYVMVDDQVQENFIDDFHTLDLNVSRYFARDIIHLTIGCKNLLNVTNVAANMAATGAHSSGSSSVPMATGRLLFARLNIDISSSKLK